MTRAERKAEARACGLANYERIYALDQAKRPPHLRTSYINERAERERKEAERQFRMVHVQL